MDTQEALEIVTSLSEGVNPVTGEKYPEDDLYNSPTIIRALYRARESLLEELKRPKKRNLPQNAGKPWKQEEDERLESGFRAGSTLEELARVHQRTPRAVELRLVKLGLIEESGSAHG